MALLTVDRIVSHRPNELFELVSDVKRYPEFIPWIKAMRVSDIRNNGNTQSFLAEALVGFNVIRERFCTRVSLDEAAHSIRVDLHSGPFRTLQNQWQFTPHGDGALVKFAIDFEFSSALLQAVLKVNKDRAAQAVMDAFFAEADRRYGCSTKG